MSERMRAITDRLADGDLPLITVANGAAVGGGVELFMCGHVRIAVRSARFRYVQSKVGVVTGWGGGARSLEALGPDVFRLMTIGDRALDAAEAREWGLVHDVVPALSLHDDVYGMARDIAALDQGAVRGFLDLTRTWVRKGRDATSQRELDLFTELWPPEW